MRAYSMDLRERVLRDSDIGLTSVAVAERYDVSRAWVDRLKQRRRETGEVAPRAQRYGPQLKLGPHPHRLLELIQEQPDRTLMELQARWTATAFSPTSPPDPGPYARARRHRDRR